MRIRKQIWVTEKVKVPTKAAVTIKLRRHQSRICEIKEKSKPEKGRTVAECVLFKILDAAMITKTFQVNKGL